jgi:methylenetetrahydrofolate reductase (NADPH)
MGVRNMLCLSGDHQSFGNHPEAKNVYDIDSMQLIALAKKMCDEGKFMNDEEIDEPPKLFIGAASNPFADPFEFRVHRLGMKIEAGADFVQTQCIYNMDKFREFMKMAVDMGLHERCYILAGVTPMKSIGMAQYMAKSVPGMDVPEALIKRLRGAGKGKVGEEGIKFALEQIEEFKEMEGVAGIHLMAIEWEHKVPEIAERAGVLPRPEVD